MDTTTRARWTDMFVVREFGPAAVAWAAVASLAAAGLLLPADLSGLVTTLWRPLVTITAIMVMAAGAQRIGLLSQLAAIVFPLARGSTHRLFLLVFVLAALTSAALNNDASVLLLTPLVVLLVRRVYPRDAGLVVPFAFAVFLAAGVAPLPVSNPINLIVADYAGIPFNSYVVRMLPIAIVGWLVTFLVLLWAFRRPLRQARPFEDGPDSASGFTRPQRAFLGLLAVVLLAYPLVTAQGGPVWLVATTGAIGALALSWRYTATSPFLVLARDVSWGTLAFLSGVLVAAVGLRNAGAVTALTQFYGQVGVSMVGIVAAGLSAVFNNHPTAFVNMLALEGAGVGQGHYLAALVGGDLGPRLLPTGSLAGLLWLAVLRRLDVRVSWGHFVRLGALVTVPTLTVSLLLLAAL